MTHVLRILLKLCAAVLFASAVVLAFALLVSWLTISPRAGDGGDPLLWVWLRNLALVLGLCVALGAAAIYAIVTRRYAGYIASTCLAVIVALGMVAYANLQMLGIAGASSSRLSLWSLELAGYLSDQRAQHTLASLRVFARDDPQEQARGFRQLQAEYEETGSAYTAGKLGWALQRGRGTEPDLARAIELYETAAGRGMTYWQILLSHAYEQGYLGLEQDAARAAYWRDRQPKIHLAIDSCWIASYYRDGTFPSDAEKVDDYDRSCRTASMKFGGDDRTYCSKNGTTTLVECGEGT